MKATRSRQEFYAAVIRIEGNAVILYEDVGMQREWRLYCLHRDLRWHIYRALPAASSFTEAVDEVDADPTGIRVAPSGR